MLLGKYLNKYYLKYGIFFLLGIAALVWVDIVQTDLPKYLNQIVTIFSKDTIDGEAIKKICIQVLILTAQMFVGRILWRLTIFHASHKIESDIRHEMFLKAEKLPVEYYHDNKVGTVMAWFTNDLESVEEFLGWGTIMLVDALFLSVIVAVKMALFKWQMALIIALPVLLIVVWGMINEKYMTMKWEERQRTYDELYDFSQETFTGIRVIKAFVKETKELLAFSKVAKKNLDVNVRFARITIIFGNIIELIIALTLSLIVGIGGYFVYLCVSGETVNLFGQPLSLTAADLVEFIAYFDLMIWPMIALGQIVTMHSRAKGSLNRIIRFLDTPEVVTNPKDGYKFVNPRGKIEFKNFSFQYPDADHLYLKNISLAINPGERVGVVGQIGSGKTTFVNVLLRLYNLEEGTLFIDDHDIMKCDVPSLRSIIAYAPQDNFIFSDTIERNIAFSDVSSEFDKVESAARFAAIDKDIEEFKDKYQTISGERGVTLSGGQKQRINIARAYFKHAPIFILDDSVSAVDVKTEDEILKHIKDKREGMTTIVIASRVSTVSSFDKILVLKNGEVEAFDTPDNCMKISPTYQKMVYLQTLEKELEGGK